MRVLWDTNIVVSGLVFSGGQAARALHEGWERWPRLLITQWISDEIDRILTSKFHATDLWAAVRMRFAVLPDPPSDISAAWAEVLRDPLDAPIAAASVWHHATHLVTGDKDLVGDLAVVRRLAEYAVHVVTIAQWLEELSTSEWE